MAGRRGSVTVAEVARRAGVSPGTVSKALNGNGQLRSATRQRVIDAARELGFAGLPADGMGPEASSGTVGVITTDSVGRFTIPVMLGAEDALGAGRIAMLLCDGRDDPIREQHYLRTLLARRVDGIIVTGRQADPRPSLGRDLPIPVVYAMAQSEDGDDICVLPDDEEGAGIAIRHLFDTGRNRIAHITGPQRHIAARLRERGAQSALSALGSDLVGKTLHGEWSEPWGREGANILMRSREPYDAVFCGSDQIARGVTDALREAGRRVPQDVAVVGFDNWGVMVEASRPPLTTIDLNLTELGHTAARLLRQAIDGRRESGVHRVPCRLIIRGSTSTSAPFHVATPSPIAVSQT